MFLIYMYFFFIFLDTISCLFPHTNTHTLPVSVTGKKLMAKCRNLLQENQELGKQISQGRVAQLEAEISLQKKYTQEVKSALDGMVPLCALMYTYVYNKCTMQTHPSRSVQNAECSRVIP